MRWWAASLLLVLAAPGVAATFVTTSVEETARSSDAVVRGRVLSSVGRLTRDGRGVVTDVEIAVERAWKGAPGTTIRLVVRGGNAGHIAQIVDAAPTFEQGEEVVVFLVHRGASWRVMGQALGKYRVEGVEARPAVTEADVLPRALPAGERAVGRMPLAELERRVKAVR